MKQFQVATLFVAVLALTIAALPGISDSAMTPGSQAAFLEDPEAEIALLSAGVEMEIPSFCANACLTLDGDDCARGQVGQLCSDYPYPCTCNWCGGGFLCTSQ